MMLWLETSLLIVLMMLVGVGILAVVVLAGRRRAMPSVEANKEENVVQLDGKGKKDKTSIRKRKGAPSEAAEGDEFMLIERTNVAETREKETTSPLAVMDTIDRAEATEEENVEGTAEEISNETVMKQQEKKPLPQSPLPQPREPIDSSEAPIPTAQEAFLMSCQNASKCADCGLTFTLLYRRHHCRKCFESVCATCSSNFDTLTGFDEPVRVCNRCWNQTRNPSVPSIINLDEGDPFTEEEENKDEPAKVYD